MRSTRTAHTEGQDTTWKRRDRPSERTTGVGVAKDSRVGTFDRCQRRPVQELGTRGAAHRELVPPGSLPFHRGSTFSVPARTLPGPSTLFGSGSGGAATSSVQTRPGRRTVDVDPDSVAPGCSDGLLHKRRAQPSSPTPPSLQNLLTPPDSAQAGPRSGAPGRPVHTLPWPIRERKEPQARDPKPRSSGGTENEGRPRSLRGPPPSAGQRPNPRSRLSIDAQTPVGTRGRYTGPTARPRHGTTVVGP